MANPNSTVTYVEPNHVFDNFTNLVGDGNNYDRMPDLEDYCIAMNIGVEVSSREDGLRKQEAENRVIILSYRDNGNNSTVNFMSGTKLGCSKKEDTATETYNAFTTYPMDMYVTDLVDYGTTEMIGVKSVTVDYNSGYIPKIRIQFTDVRGMSLFQPKELNYDNSVNGIRGLSKDNIAQTFFQCFFNLPLPKFTIQIKGFYGRSVTYQVMCESFVTNFNSSTGDFDIDTSFIGYGFSFMSDISFDALLAAPYSDYYGEEYWNSQVKDERFVILDKTGQKKVPMPRLYDIRKNFETLFNESGVEFDINSLTTEEKYHQHTIEDLKVLADDITSWYLKLYNNLVKNYGKELVCLYKNGEGYDAILLLTNTEGDFQSIYEQLDENVQTVTSNLYGSIEKYNESSDALGKIKNLKKFDEYKTQRIFKNEYVDVNTNEVIFDGFEPSCRLPRRKTMDMLFPDGHDKAKVRKIYNDGVNQYVYGFYIELDYTVLKVKAASLAKDASMTDDEKTKREKRKIFNQQMFEKMNWYPTIENFTKIVMAHLETLMAMMYQVVTKTEGRTVADLGVSIEDCADVNTNGKPEEQYIPPFPRITRLTTDEDGITKREDAWIGEFGRPGKEIPEIDMVNGLFNGISAILKLEDSIEASKNEINKGEVDLTKEPGKVKYPTTPYDLYIEKNLYGDSNDVASDINIFIGKVALRMFDVLAINTFRYQYGENWVKNNVEKLGKVEAMNFDALTTLSDTKIFEAINVGGALENGNKAWDIITGTTTDGSRPWGNGKLLNDDRSSAVWLDLYKSNNGEFIYPAQNFDFNSLSKIPAQINRGKYPVGNEDVIISDVKHPRTYLGDYLRSSNDNAFFNFFIEEDRNRFMNAYNNASSQSSDEAYSDILTNYVSKAAEYNSEALAAIFKPSSDSSGSFKPSSFIGKFPKSYSQKGVGETSYKTYYKLTSENISSYLSSDSNESICESISLSEVFGVYTGLDKYVTIGTGKTYFTREYFFPPSSEDNFEAIYDLDKNLDVIFFLMGINGIDYTAVSQLFGDKQSFVYLPKIIALQIGAILSLIACNKWNIYTNISRNNINKINMWIPVPANFECMVSVINKMNSFAKVYLIKYFDKWAKNNRALIKDLKKYCLRTKTDKRTIMVLKQNNPNVKKITNELLSIVIVVRGNVNSFKNENGTTFTRENFKFTKDDAIKYLDAFITKLREINKIGDENGNLTQLAKVAEKTTDDMKMELYRYLKQIYDKWIPTTDFKDWKYETFFGGATTKDGIGHQFHFIDSYYNKTNKKLIINPRIVSSKILKSISHTDINVMMHTFLSDVYAEHRCMLRCVQNFADLGNDTLMGDIFTPIPYNEMEKPDIHPDFVVVYTYEPSKNLNIDNGEFKDDSFMLNEEMDTPMAIRTRAVNDSDGYYKIPAFGVSYGKQYQNYFKNVNVGMKSPIQTQQSLIAKHSILRASRDDKSSKTVTAQDLYDIYSTQSYTCDVEMMGCAWVQPMMYFVLLNIPMFRGSYMIMKVTHKITPGDMTTTFTGCRMANVGNRFIQDIFSEEDNNGENGEEDATINERNACVDNNCPYKVYPLVEAKEAKDTEISTDELTNANNARALLRNSGFTDIAIAGICGNIYKESTWRLHVTNGIGAFGLCQWTRSGGRKERLIAKYGKKPTFNQQMEFIAFEWNGGDSIAKAHKNDLQSAKTPEDAAYIVRKYFERPGKKEADDTTRKSKARLYYNNFGKSTPAKTTPSTSPEVTNDNIALLLFNAVQKSLSSTDSSTMLEFAHTNEKRNEPTRPLVITQQNGGNNQLAKVFDIILNTPSYYKHAQYLCWACSSDGAQGPNPKAVVVDVVLEAVKEQQSVFVADYIEVAGFDSSSINNYNFVMMEGKKPEEIVNKRLLMPLYKHFGGKLSKEYRQFKSEELFKDLDVSSCSNITGGNGNVNYSGGEVVAGAKIMIGKWDVEKSVQWINRYSRDAYNSACKTGSPRNKKGKCTSLCATYVLEAMCCKNNGAFPESNFPNAGGRISCGNTPRSAGAATNLRYAGILEKYDFDIIKSGDCTKDNRAATGVQLQAGDIAIIGRSDSGKFHACMWNGEQWVSDYKQGEKMSPYGGSESYPGGTLPYAIYRYLYKKGVKATKK